jgi:hypothetical protein
MTGLQNESIPPWIKPCYGFKTLIGSAGAQLKVENPAWLRTIYILTNCRPR